MNQADSFTTQAIKAQAELHHQYLLGLQLRVAMHEGATVIGEWMFRLFRSQHEDKFLSSFKKLGLNDLPHAIACAKYHVLSNGIGGVRVEYMEESSKKAWVRFRYPRWMFAGPAICGIPVEASRGFLRGWYARNGVSLNNPKLGFVCVSEDMTAQFGLCGYFFEYDHELTEDERLQFAPNELPPEFKQEQQPLLPTSEWNDERLEKANRNYAMEYIRNGIRELTGVIGKQKALAHSRHAARLTGLQFYPTMAIAVNAADGDLKDAAKFIADMLAGMGDKAIIETRSDSVLIKIDELRILRGLSGDERENLLSCWVELWRGAIHSHRLFMTLDSIETDNHHLWQLSRNSGNSGSE